jgi:preprotein translocase subunit SecG
MYQLILLVHVFVAVFIVVLVLIQQGKGATMGASFGSGASQTVFGSRGSGSFLFRVTIGCAAIFFATSITLNYLMVLFRRVIYQLKSREE